MFCYTAGMNPTWRYRDIIDLEFFLSRDQERIAAGELTAVRQRDRRIYTQIIEPVSGADNTCDRRHRLLLWLEGRRQEERDGGDGILPGALAEEIFTGLGLVFPALGFAAGFSAGLSFFVYTGTAPLNVFHYLAVFVFSQLCILLLAAVMLLVRARKTRPTPSLLVALTAGVFQRIYRAAAGRLRAGLSAQRRDEFAAALGAIRGKRRYAPLFFWPIVSLMQLFAGGLNLGLLAVMLYKVAITDVAFGWQSTIRFSPETISQLVHLLALPWSWCIPGGLAAPSLQEIEGSRIILKDGIAHLATADLISWWPFLCFAVITYGLLPRLGLLALAAFRQTRCLRELRFDQAVFDRLFLRLQTPLVSSQATAEGPAEPKPPLPQPVRSSGAPAPDKMCVLVPDEIFDHCPEQALHRFLGTGADTVITTMRIGANYESDRRILADLAEADFATPILILAESWLPPIADTLAFLKDLRTARPAPAPIRLVLLGKPGPETIFTPADPGDRKIWQHKLDSLGDPYLSHDTPF